jgi:hypothetical protein
MTFSKLHLLVLNCTTDDHEDLRSIVAEVQTGLAASESEIVDVLRDLVGTGLIEAYAFDPVKGSFTAPSADLRKAWFLISDKGREALDEGWGESR